MPILRGDFKIMSGDYIESPTREFMNPLLVLFSIFAEFCLQDFNTSYTPIQLQIVEQYKREETICG